MSECVCGEAQSEPPGERTKILWRDGRDVGLGTEVEVLEMGELCLDVVGWCYDEVCAREGAMGDRIPMQWSVSRCIKVFWEEEVQPVCGDLCGVFGAERMNKVDGEVGNRKQEI